VSAEPIQGPALAGAGRRPTWLEGFYDLVFAFAVTELAGRLGRDASPAGVAGFVFLFLSVWWAWVGTTVFFDRFERGLRWQRLTIGAQLLAAAALAVHVGDALEGGGREYALAYAAIRFVLVGLYFGERRHRAGGELARHYARGFALAAGIWLVSAFVPPPARFTLWGIAMIIDYGTPLTARRMHVRSPLDRSHLPERFGLFTLIVLGESIAATAASLTGRGWSPGSGVAGALGIVAAFGIWWSYFDNLERAPLHRPRLAGQVWFYAHLPFLMAMTALAIALHGLVSAGVGAGPAPARLGAAIACALTLGFLAVIRLSGIEPGSRAEIGWLALATGLGIVVSALVAVVPLAAAGGVALVAVACAVPAVLDEVRGRWPELAR
jgi:low temperature requirement protein LtrA